MKKVLIVLLMIFILFSVATYIFIPKQLTVSKVSLVHANENALLRYLSDEQKWERWWPAKQATFNQKGLFTYNGFSYHLTQILYHEVDVYMMHEAGKYSGKIRLVPITPDTIGVKWETTFETSANPFSRFSAYRMATKMKNNMKVILDSLKAFNEKSEGIYDYHIRRTTIKDTTLVAAKFVTTAYPATKDIYHIISSLKKYIASQGAKETNYPMLNVTTSDSIHYTTMVAVPTNKELRGTQKITVKRMVIYTNKTIIAEVKGGPATIKNAYKELNLYMQDYNLTNPVIHWESLVTDRSKEADSSKWITKIFMPVV